MKNILSHWSLRACIVALGSFGCFPATPEQVAQSQPAQPQSAAKPAPPTPAACLMDNGLAYGPFRDGQSPDTNVYPSAEQIKEDLTFLSHITKQIRIYSTKGTFALIPEMAKQLGLSVAQGIYLGADKDENKESLEAALGLARDNLIDTIIVGNEELTGSLISKQELLDYIRSVRKSAPAKVRVSTAETASVWQSNLDLAQDVDFVVAHFYPFWQAHRIDGVAEDLVKDYNSLKSELKRRYPTRDLQVVIGETGWPSGLYAPRPGVEPSEQNQRKYVEEFFRAACGNAIPFYWFEAFDEEWKWNEGGSGGGSRRSLPNDRTLSGRWLGSSWGLYDSNGKLKPHLTGLFDQPDPGSRRDRDIFVDGRLSGYYDIGLETSGKMHKWAGTQERALRLDYPADQDWGSLFITVGKPGPYPHPWRDFSKFKTLSVELKGANGGEAVEVGVLTASDPATGDEKRYVIDKLPSSFKTYDIPLENLRSPHLAVPQDLKELYVVAEFVFKGTKPATVFVRNIRFKP